MAGRGKVRASGRRALWLCWVDRRLCSLQALVVEWGDSRAATKKKGEKTIDEKPRKKSSEVEEVEAESGK